MNAKLLSSAVVAATLAMASPAVAGTTFAGGAQGCFTQAGDPACTVSTTPSADGGLTYTGGTATFSQETDDVTGLAAIGGGGNNFGTITLVPNTRNYSSDLFSLLISFTAPAGASDGSFTATLLGRLAAFGSGGVQISFLNPDQTLSDGAGGTFLLHVNNVSFSGSLLPGQEVPTSLSQDISGYIQAAVPEPSTWAMMLLGFGGMGFAMRRRQKSGLAQIA